MSVAWFEKLPVLDSTIVALEPLSLIHLQDLQSAASGADCWEYEHSLVPRPGGLDTYVEHALADAYSTQREQPFHGKVNRDSTAK